VPEELDKWWEEYKPVPNHLCSENTKEEPSLVSYFETYGEELDYIRSVDSHNIWTWIDGDEGSCLVPGYHLVNRIGFFVTEKQWADRDLAVTVIPYDFY
jgi:hypothetical protein